jgi:hypothetical protein
MYLQRASLQSEALLPTLADGVLSGLRGCFSFLLTSFLFLVAAVSTSVLAWHRSNCRHCYPHTFGCRATLSDAWVRELLWRRGQELDAGKHRQLAKDLKSLSVETLISKSWIWYAPLMLHRCDAQWLLSGDRRCTVAVDGNAKLHRRTCGQPFAEAPLSFNGHFALLFKLVLLALVISYLFLANLSQSRSCLVTQSGIPDTGLLCQAFRQRHALSGTCCGARCSGPTHARRD